MAKTLLAAGARKGSEVDVAVQDSGGMTAATNGSEANATFDSAEESQGKEYNDEASMLGIKERAITIFDALVLIPLFLAQGNSPLPLAGLLSSALLALMMLMGVLLPHAQLAVAILVLVTGAVYIHRRRMAAAILPDPVLVTAVQSVLTHVDQKGAKLTDGEQLAAYLFYAGSGHEAVVQLLLDNGVDMSSKDSDGATPLHHAAFFGCARVTKP